MRDAGPSLSETLPRRSAGARSAPSIFHPKRVFCLPFLGSRTQIEQNHSAEVRSVIIIFSASITRVMNR